MEKIDEWRDIRELLRSTVLMQEGYQQAKKRYASKIAPDFRLLRFSILMKIPFLNVWHSFSDLMKAMPREIFFSVVFII